MIEDMEDKGLNSHSHSSSSTHAHTDARVLSGLGKAFWSDHDDTRRSLAETLDAVSLLNLSLERRLEKTSQALLERGRRNQVEFTHPFFRLIPDERFILVALHIGRWSYDRLAKILGRPVDEIQEIAWSARIKLVTSSVGGPIEQYYPHGPHALSTSCPSYHSTRPWPQRFLDEEIPSAREQVFLKEHLLECTSCSQFLARCREGYFKVEKEVERLSTDPELDQLVERVLFDTKTFSRYRSDLSFKDSLLKFLKNKDIQIMLAIYLVLLIYRIIF